MKYCVGDIVLCRNSVGEMKENETYDVTRDNIVQINEYNFCFRLYGSVNTQFGEDDE